MTSYDEENNRSDFSPAYGIHLHDPRLLEYVGAPELARLLSRTPEYWLHHMGRGRTLAAALQLQHGAGLIMSNIQVLAVSIGGSTVGYTISPGSSGGSLFGSYGLVASDEQSRSTGPSAVVVVQCVQVLFGLLLMLCFPTVMIRGEVKIKCYYVYICHPTGLVLLGSFIGLL